MRRVVVALLYLIGLGATCSAAAWLSNGSPVSVIGAAVAFILCDRLTSAR